MTWKIKWMLGMGLILAHQAEAAGGRLYRFWVGFKDKPEYLLTSASPISSESMARRLAMGIPLQQSDYPVHGPYLSAVHQMGLKKTVVSKWLNGAVFETTDSALIEKVAKMVFVKEVKLVQISGLKRGMADANLSNDWAVVQERDLVPQRITMKNKGEEVNWNQGYGHAWKQAQMLGIPMVHGAGFMGKGIRIAVLDAGFQYAQYIEVFDSLFQSGRWLGQKDFVDGDGNVFDNDDHGTQVLSCMAANLPGTMIGTAPYASYLLLRSEDAGSESLAEEINWVAAAEYADSVGVDIIHSSLGYSTFDYAFLDHAYEDLDGKTSFASRGANMAYEKGMVVVNSAGNEGDGLWRYIGVPADAYGVLAIGSVNENYEKSGFSSWNWKGNKSVKPDFMAMGEGTQVANPSGYIFPSNGTSYSAPVFTGALASVMQSLTLDKRNPAVLYPRLKSLGYMSAVKKEGYGYGILDFYLVLGTLSASKVHWKDQNHDMDQYYISGLKKGDTLLGGFELKVSPIYQVPELIHWKLEYEAEDAMGNPTKEWEEGEWNSKDVLSIPLSAVKKGKVSLELTDTKGNIKKKIWDITPQG